MTIKRTPSVIGPTDPDVARKLQANLKQAAVIANGRPTVANSELILPSTTIRTSPASITLTTSANNQPSDTVTVYPSSGNVYVSTIDQTIQQNIVNQTGVYSIIAGNNITITSTGVGGTGNVTINSLGGGSGSTGNITFSGTTMTGPAGSVDSYSIYIQPSADFTNALQIYPTADNDIHLFEASGNAITLGDYGQSQISVWGPNSPNANITLQSNGNIWEFGENGLLTFPDGTEMGDVEGSNTFGFYSNNANMQFLLEASSNNWVFDGATSNFTTPSNLVIGANSGGGSSIYQFDAPLQVIGESANSAVVVGWTANSSGPEDVVAIAFNSPYPNGASNLVIGVGNNATTVNYWNFANDGTTTFPTLTVDLHNGGNQSAQTLQFGDNTQQAIITGPTPTGNNNAERLIIQGQRGAGTGEGGDVYLWAGDSDTAGGDIKIYAGDADNVSAGYGGYINITGGQGFDGGGDVSITGGRSTNSAGAEVRLIGGLGATTGGTANVQGGQGAVAGGIAELKGGYGGGSGGNVNIVGGGAGNGLAEYGNVNISAGASSWAFDNSGNLTLSGGGSIFSTNSTPSGAPGNTITLQPAGSGITTNQKLMIYPTAADGDHIHMTSGNLYETELFLGSDNFYAKLANTGDIVLHANTGLANATWTFSANSSLILPGAGVQMDAATNALLTSGIANTTIGTLAQGPQGYISWEYLPDGGNANTGYGAIGLSNETLAGTQLNFKIELASDNGNAASDHVWIFDATGNLTLPANTFSINYANGTQVPLGGGSYGDSNVVSLLSSFGSNTITTTGNISGGNLLASANVLSNGYARFSGTFDESLASTAGLYVGYAGGTPRVMFGTGTTSQTFEIDNDGGNLRFYKPGSTKATLTSAGDFSVSGNITAVNLFGSLANGNSNVSIATANGNVTIAAVGNTTMTITGTGANITGTLNATGNANVGNIGATAGVFTTVTGNLTTAIQSNVTRTGTLDQLVVSNTVYADGYGARTGSDITLSTAGNGNLIISTAGTGITNFSNKAVSNISNLSATGTLSVTGNANVGNIGATNGVFTGNISGNTNGFTIGYLNIPQVAASNTTIALSDAGKHYYSTSAGNFTLTIPNNTSVSFATGTAISIVVQSAGNVLVNAVSGVTLYMAGNSTAANRVVSNYGMATIMKVATDTWMINGTGVA